VARGVPRADIAPKVSAALDLVGLAGFGDRYPRQLSGGQQQRVGVARALAADPPVLLMDEPFASLDAIVRTHITQELIGWVERENLTVLLVTHDLEEAISLSDAVYVLSQGPRARIRSRHAVEIARPRDLLATRDDPQFPALLKRLWDELSAEAQVQAVGEAAQ
jgi:NitT/TauT family transport system ATP-binding protein